MIKKYSFILFLFSLFQVGVSFAQDEVEAGPGCPNVDIQDVNIGGHETIYNEDLDRYELHLPCGVNEIDLTTTYLPGREGEQYEVTSIPYAPPFDFEGGSNAVPLTSDDFWSPTIDMGFDFCFFWEPYNKALITDNGALTFDINGEAPGGGSYTPGASSGWSFDAEIPDGTATIPYRNAIFGVMQDLLPSASSPDYSVNHEIIGEAPCRMLVFNIFEAGHFGGGCAGPGNWQTSQIVLYETTNAIDVFVKDRTVCSWNEGSGLIGVQSRGDHPLFQHLPNGIQGYAPEGRNTGQWEAHDEAWRFTPSGNITNTIKWFVDDVLTYDEQGNEQGSNTRNFVLNQAETTIRVEGTYVDCSRNETVDISEITVITSEGFEVDLGEDINECNVEDVTLTPTITDVDGNVIPESDYDTLGFEFLWSPNGETTSSITVTESGTYTVTVDDGNCVSSDSIEVEIGDLTLSDSIATYTMCADENGSATFDLTNWYDEIIPNAQDYDFTFYESEDDANANTNQIPDPENHLLTTPPGNQEIWVHVNEVDGCEAIGSFTIEIGEVDYDEVTPYIICDNSGSGTGSFDLDSKIPDIINGRTTDLTVTFHPTQVDAEDDTSPITSPHNAADGDIVFVRIFDEDMECPATYEMTLELGQGPDIEDLAPYALCGFDGLATFDLPTIAGDLTDGLIDPQMTFHLDSDDAYQEDVVGEIENPEDFENTVVDGQTIYVRVQEEGVPCFTVVELPIEVMPTPVVNENIDDYALCEIDNDEAIFDLTSIEVITNPEDFDITYYLSDTDAQGEIDAIDAADLEEYTSTSTTIWVRVQDDNNGCWDITSFDLVVNPLPDLLTEVVELSECDDGSGTALFDLEDVIVDLATTPTDFTFTFHNTAADATAGDNAIDPTVDYPGTDAEEIFIRVESEFECASFATLTLNVTAAQEVEPQEPYALCDEGGGQADFDLAGLIPGIQDGDTNLEVTFYLTNDDALVGDVNDQIIPPYTSATRTIYVRVVAQQGAVCPGTAELDLVVDPLPDLPESLELVDCENPDGPNEFDLLDPDLHEAILGEVAEDESEYDILFFETEYQASTAAATDALDVTDPYETGETTRVWVRVTHTDSDTQCEAIMPILITVNPLPVINDIEPLQVCDIGDANGIAEFNLNLATADMVGESNYNVNYYLDEVTAEEGDVANALDLDYTNVDPYNQTVFARIADNITECYIVVPVDLIVEEAPEANTPEPLIYCDPNNDGEGTFHLPDAIADITSDDDAVVTFHRTEADAENNANPLDDEVNNNEIGDGGPNQIIYVRVAIDGIDCYSIVELELIVLPTPVLETPEEVFIGCDIDDNGTPIFNLVEIVEGQVTIHLDDLDDYNIYYYASEENRDNDSRIAVPSAYPSEGGTVIVVVEDILTGCSSEVEIELFVAPLPEVFAPAHMEVCDVNNPGDEVELFYLDEAIEEITGGDASLSVTFHETQEDADSGENALEIPYENEHNNQTIYLRIENEYGCTVTEDISLTLVVNPLPEPVIPEPYEVCDIDNEGFAYFDLDSLVDEIIGNEPDVNVSFHETRSDADNGFSPLDSPYQNIVGEEQVIFARVYFDDQPEGTGCFTVIEIILRAMPSPIVPTELDDLYFCTADMDAGVRVNLTVYEDAIYGDQDRDAIDLTYHLTEDAALAGTGAIANPADYLLNPPTPTTIYVRLGYTDGECFNVVPFILHLVDGPEINDPTPLAQCAPLGEGNPEESVFDLLDKREEIIGDATGLDIRFYELEEDALAGNDNHIQDPTNYTNIENPQTVYIRVIDSQENEEDTGCVAFTTLTLRVDPTPEPEMPDPIEICHLDHEAETTFVDLTIRELQILNHEDWDLEYYERYRDAVNGDQEELITNPDAYELALEDSPKTIYVRVINDASGCFEIVELEVILSQLPEVVLPEDIEPMVVCVTDGSGRASFDLNSKIPEIFGNQNLDNFEVFFYEDIDEAIEGINPIPNPGDFYNRETPQTIYVGVGNPDIDECYIGGLTYFEIRVEEGAQAFSPDTAYNVCGIPGENGDIGIFDLNNEDLIDSILGMQDPDFFDVDFFLTEEDAHEGAPEDHLSSPYENIENPQVIFARVTNQETGCYAIAEVILEVNPLPGLMLDDTYSICTDQNGDPMEDADGNIIFPIIDTGLEEEGYDFTWYFEGDKIVGQVGPSLEADQVGTYTVEIISDAFGCTLSLDIEVVESSLPFTYGAEVVSPAFSGLYNIDAWAEGFGDYWFSLDGGTAQNEGEWSNVGPGSHIVTITDMNGCGSVEVVVNVVDYPKFFTPNDDGYNDTWNIPGMAELDPSAEIHIFDRHGKLLKQINPSSEGWDGTFNGKELPSTDYWFVVKYEEDGEPKEFKGHFSLKR